jgi:hypothetical protein
MSLQMDRPSALLSESATERAYIERRTHVEFAQQGTALTPEPAF